MHERNATYRVDDAIEIEVHFDYLSSKKEKVCAHFSYRLDRSLQKAFTIRENKKEQTTVFSSFSCAIPRYLHAALRVASYIGFDVENAVGGTKESSFTFFDLRRRRIVTEYLQKNKRIATLDEKEQQEMDLQTLRSLNPEYCAAFQSASFVKTVENETYNLPWLVFKVTLRQKEYEVFAVKYGGRNKSRRDGDLFVRNFGETVMRPEICAEVRYCSDQQLYLTTFHTYGSVKKRIVTTVVLEKFGKTYDFGVYEQNDPPTFSVPEYNQYLWEAGTLPKSEDEQQFEDYQQREQEKQARDARRVARDEKKKTAKNADEEMSDQEKADNLAEEEYQREEDEKKRNRAAMQRIIDSVKIAKKESENKT